MLTHNRASLKYMLLAFALLFAVTIVQVVLIHNALEENAFWEWWKHFPRHPYVPFSPDPLIPSLVAAIPAAICLTAIAGVYKVLKSWGSYVKFFLAVSIPWVAILYVFFGAL